MKQFKCEIDHEIAKCLDTLDRQGLKFLKETLRASKLFALNTQQLNNTLPPEEEKPQPKAKDQPSPRKKDSTKNIKVTKTVKGELSKKPSSAQKQTRANDGKGNLSQKIQKRLQSLNIKTGKRTDSKTQLPSQQKKQKKVQSKPAIKQPLASHQIQEEIQAEDIIQNISPKEENLPIQEDIKPQEFVELNNATAYRSLQPQKHYYQPTNDLHHNAFLPKQEKTEAEQALALKPFHKKTYKQHTLSQEKSERPQSVEESQPIQAEPAAQTNFLSPKRETSQQLTQKVQFSVSQDQTPINYLEDSKQSEKEEKQEIMDSLNINQEWVSPELLNIIQKIKNLPPNKILKLEKVLEKFEDPAISESNLSSHSEQQQPSYIKPLIQVSFATQNKESRERSKSRSRLQKMQKATSIKSSMVKRYQQAQTKSQLTPELDKNQIQSAFEQSNLQTHNRSIQEEHKLSRSKPIQKLTNEDKFNTPIHQLIEETSQPIIQNNSNSFRNSQSGNKLFKISKKKSSNTNITVKLLSNYGHPSVVALSSIFIYNLVGELIAIDQSHLRQSNSKLIKLFNNQSTEGWMFPLSSATVVLEAISQSIGGIRIVNYNKSAIENSKQADLAQISLNEQLFWRGQLRGGPFKEDQNYITDIKIANKDFEFPMLGQQMAQSHLKESRSLASSWRNKQKIDLEQERNKGATWLEKDSISKMRQIQQLQKNQSKVKKIQSIRNTVLTNSLELQKPIEQLSRQTLFQPKIEAQLAKQESPFQSKIEAQIAKQQSPFQPQIQARISKQESPFPFSPSRLKKTKIQESNDILGQLSKSIGAKNKINASKQEQAKKREESKTKEESKPKEQLKTKRQQAQEDEFDQIIKSLQKKEKNQKKEEKKQQPVALHKQQTDNITKTKITADKKFEDFMKDSLFDDLQPVQKTAHKPTANNNLSKEKNAEHYRSEEPKKAGKQDLDDLIDELNDAIGSENQEETGEEFLIPELPQGRELTMVLLSNWGNQQYIGLNGVELFDSNGDLIRPTEIISSSQSSDELMRKLCKQEMLTSDQRMQIKLAKNKKIILLFVLPGKIELAAARIWNYNGHRVHNNIGVKKCHLRLDNNYIFSGEIKQSSGSSEDAHKFCEYVLFTESNSILKKISDKDWLSRKQTRNQEEIMLFKSTLEHFHRPPTRNDEQAGKKEVLPFEKEKSSAKMYKRMYFEYEPPQLPQGFALKFILHSNWGDQFFIGLNGIEVFNEKAEVITTQNLSQIRADPSSINKLEGYQGDKRIVTNLINNQNNTTSDTNIWLAPLLSDVEKIEKGRSNLIIMDYAKSNKIGGINFYNYTKTPERGVREIEIYLDNYLLYRGYLRKYNPQEGIIHTTVSFTKEQPLLENMNCIPYNEDHLEQEVGLVNEQKIVKQYYLQAPQQQLVRPMTGKQFF